MVDVTNVILTVQISCAEADLTILPTYINAIELYQYEIGDSASLNVFDKLQYTSTETESPCPTMSYIIVQDGYPSIWNSSFDNAVFQIVNEDVKSF